MAQDQLARIHRLEIPVPNPALQEWLVSNHCRRAVVRFTEEVLAEWRRLVEVRTGTLLRGAYEIYAISNIEGTGGLHTSTPRWVGWIANPVPYAAVHEWGKSGTRFKGHHEMARAASLVAAGKGRAGLLKGFHDIKIPSRDADPRGLRGNFPKAMGNMPKAARRSMPKQAFRGGWYDGRNWRNFRGQFIKRPKYPN